MSWAWRNRAKLERHALAPHTSVELLVRSQVSEPALKDRVVERQSGEVANRPGDIQGLLRATGQAAIAAYAPTAQDWVRLQGNVVHRAFAHAPLTLVASSRVESRLGHDQAQKAVGTDPSNEIVESLAWFERVRAAFGHGPWAASRHMLRKCQREISRAGQVLYVGTIGQPADEARSGMMKLPTGQEAADHVSSSVAQQSGEVVEHSAGRSAGGRKDKSALPAQGWKGA